MCLDAGNKNIWLACIIGKSLLYSVFCVYAFERYMYLYPIPDGSIITMRLLYEILIVVVYYLTVLNCWEINNANFYVENGMFCGVDLWNVEKVRIGTHCIYLDKVCVESVPSPRKLVMSLEDYYYNMTGECLP